MSEEIKITYAKEKRTGAVLRVIGVGGGGGNAINRMIEEKLQGVEFIAVNTDVQDLANIKSPGLTLQIGEKITKGLGVGSNADMGMQAALENTDAIIEMLEGAHMVFITAGMGGGTGTGASQVIANHAASMGILTVAIVTKPFEFEGSNRMKVAEEGIKALKESVDAIITIPNQKLFELEDADMSFKDAYKKVDEILLRAVRGISDIISTPGYQNVDFADVKAVMHEKGVTLMGTGEARGENRAEEAARKTLTSPLLDNLSIHGATGILYNITASSSLTLKEIGRIADIINCNASPDARIKFGIVDDENMGDLLRVTVIATGFKETNERKANSRSLHKIVTPSTPLSAVPPMPPMSSMPPISTPPPALIEETKDFIDFDENRSFYLGAKNKPKATNITEYVNESNIPNMIHDPESVDDILDVPSFQRFKLTERRLK